LPCDPLTLDLYAVEGYCESKVHLKDHVLTVSMDTGREIWVNLSEIRQQTILQVNHISADSIYVNGKKISAEKIEQKTEQGVRLTLPPA